MTTFDRSVKHQNNYAVSKDGKVVYFHQREIGELKSCLEAAVDPNTGTGTWRLTGNSMGVQSKVYARRGEVELDNGLNSRITMGYEEARELIKQIEDRLLKDATIERQIKRMGG
jgi:hypothetical protein